MSNWEIAKVILEFLSSLLVFLGIIIASWKGLAFFKYKIDADTRELYINNANEVNKILGYFYANGRVKWEQIFELNNAYRNASLYLHKDVVEFIETLRKYLCELTALQDELEPLPVGEERTKHCKKILELKLKISEHSKSLYQVYRNQILDDGFKIKDLKFWDKDICKKQ